MDMETYPLPLPEVIDKLHAGIVIPAHPLALDARRRLDERRQRALARYYHAAGAGGIAVGVHTTQFEIRDRQYSLFEPVLELAAETIADCDRNSGRFTVRIAGICGDTRQAVSEATFAAESGYHAGLLSLAALGEEDDDVLIEHCRQVARVMPLVGFYLQPAVGGRRLSRAFWRRFAEIPNVVAIKVAPFNRYQTDDVVRAVGESDRWQDIALYTGNDDHIILDLITEFVVHKGQEERRLHFSGGLLGHWACWTKKAVDILEESKAARKSGCVPSKLLTQAADVTDCNAAFFDAANHFAGVIPGIHEVLRRQRLMTNVLCLNPNENLSPGQKQEIDRVYAAYPDLNDDAFVRQHLDRWLA